MQNAKNLFRSLLEDKWRTPMIRRIYVAHNLNQQKHPDENHNNLKSLFYTTLPRRKKVSKVKPKKGSLPSGPLLIDSKREEFIHFKGMHYGKFDVIPLASKGWYHRKSKEDYFTILPTSDHPAFIFKEDVPLTFEELGVSSKIIEQLKTMNVFFPTSIQAKAIKSVLEGNNTLMAAETGCGKTLAYLIPIVQNVIKWKEVSPELYNAPFAIIIIPTRELAMQVGEVAKNLSENLGLKVLINIGLSVKSRLLNPEMTLYDLLVCTPGVLNRFMSHKLILTERCKHVVVDEADTLMDDSFSQGVKKFFRKSRLKYVGLRTDIPRCAQACFVSATMPSDADTFLSDVCPASEVLKISTNYLHRIQPHIPQKFLRVSRTTKAETLLKIVRENVAKRIPTMIFSNKTKTCDWVSLFLNENKVKTIRINSRMNPEERLKEFQNFKFGEVDVISCTDIASRGLDTTRVKHVINFDFPRFLADYIHRCGRTGRINHSKNCFITNIISKKSEVPLVNEIEKTARMDGLFPKVRNNIARLLQHKHSIILEQQESDAKNKKVKKKQEIDDQMDVRENLEKSQI